MKGALICLTHGTVLAMESGLRFAPCAFECHPDRGAGYLPTQIPGTPSEKPCLWEFKA